MKQSSSWEPKSALTWPRPSPPQDSTQTRQSSSAICEWDKIVWTWPIAGINQNLNISNNVEKTPQPKFSLIYLDWDDIAF